MILLAKFWSFCVAGKSACSLGRFRKTCYLQKQLDAGHTATQFRNTANFTARAMRKKTHNSVSCSWYTPHPSDPSSSRSNLLGWTVAGRRMPDYALLVYRTNKVHRMWWQSVEAKIILEVASWWSRPMHGSFSTRRLCWNLINGEKACCFLLCFVPPVLYTWTVHFIRTGCTCFCVSLYVVRWSRNVYCDSHRKRKIPASVQQGKKLGDNLCQLSPVYILVRLSF